jgi:hypothetical protein
VVTSNVFVSVVPELTLNAISVPRLSPEMRNGLAVRVSAAKRS